MLYMLTFRIPDDQNGDSSVQKNKNKNNKKLGNVKAHIYTEKKKKVCLQQPIWATLSSWLLLVLSHSHLPMEEKVPTDQRDSFFSFQHLNEKTLSHFCR